MSILSQNIYKKSALEDPIIMNGEVLFMKVAKRPLMSGLTNSLCDRNFFQSEVITSLLHNSESWIGIKEYIIQIKETNIFGKDYVY